MKIFQETTCQQYVDAMTCLLNEANASKKYDQLNADFQWWISRRQNEDASERTSVCNLTIALINEQQTLSDWPCEGMVDTGWTLQAGKPDYITQNPQPKVQDSVSSAYELGQFTWKLFILACFIVFVAWAIKRIRWK